MFCLASLSCLKEVYAETIYQWTDPWGQIQYSKTPVSGSSVSELTELPEARKVTEQQKQDAMLKKIQEMKNSNKLLKQKNSEQKYLRQQAIKNDNHCRKLRNLLTDVKLRKTRLYNLPAASYYQRHYYFPDQYDYSLYDNLENDLHWEIQKYCR